RGPDAGLVNGQAADRVCMWMNGGSAPTAALLPSLRPGFAWRLAAGSSRTAIEVAEELTANRVDLPGRAVVIIAEVAETRPRRSAAADDELIDRLATAAGIQPEWRQLDG